MTRFILAASLLLVATPFSLAAPAPDVRLDLTGPWRYELSKHFGVFILTLHKDGSYVEHHYPAWPSRSPDLATSGHWRYTSNRLWLNVSKDHGGVFRIHARSTRQRVYASWQPFNSQYHYPDWARTELQPHQEPVVKAATNPEREALEDELRRFPPLEACKEMVALANAHEKWIEGRMRLFPQERFDLSMYLLEVRYQRTVWINLIQAQDAGFLTYYRSNCLEDVREAIGEFNYLQGFLWPPVAAHLLPRGD